MGIIKHKKPKVIAILPAYQAEKTLASFLKTFPYHYFYRVILVDDCSTDGTFDIAKKYSRIIIDQTPHNLGYGGNLKYCLTKALSMGADIMVELHPDGEYGADGILPAIEAIGKGAHFVVGNRFTSRKKNGMIPIKYLVTRILTYTDNWILGTRIPDLHQGFRVYTKTLLTKVPYKKDSDDYSFSFEVIVQALYLGLSVASVPVTARYTGKKRGASMRASTIYTIKTAWILFLFLLAKCGIPSTLFSRSSI